jgi:hypothetical protein
VKLVIFLGPSLPLSEARQLLAADYRPPAARGDVYRAALERPWGIGIVDGYFEREPAVWHKEILWAMSRGVHVFGASSMGALRAAELAAFGMVGVGEIFEAFREGALSDDDEVTIAHADAAAGYRGASTALVDIRATLAAAREQAVLSEQLASELLAIAKRMHYVDRSYRRVLLEGRAHGIDLLAIERFERWLPSGEVQLKRSDAQALLRHMREQAELAPEPKQVAFAFEHTDAFERFVQAERVPHAAGVAVAEVVEELRLDAARYAKFAERSWARLLALELAERLQIATDDVIYREAVTEFRRARGLHDAAATQAWLNEQQLDRFGLARQIREQTQTRVVRQIFAGELEAALLAELRSANAYPTLARRARHKRELLCRYGFDEADLTSCALSERDLIDWYMGEIGATNTQQEVIALCAQLDFADAHAFLRMVMREYLYQRLVSGDAALDQGE